MRYNYTAFCCIIYDCYISEYNSDFNPLCSLDLHFLHGHFIDGQANYHYNQFDVKILILMNMWSQICVLSAKIETFLHILVTNEGIVVNLTEC